MAFQVATLCKSLPTGLAQERFLSGVDAFMNFQLAARSKSLSAGVARDQLLSEVGAHMHFQMPVVFKRFATCLAFKSSSDTVPSQGTLSLLVIATVLAGIIACCLHAIPFH